jgi:hypothetical protein
MAAVAAAAVLLAGLLLPAAEPAKPKVEYGYDDTPFLPNSPWRVHDRKRPQPPMVAPGTAGQTVQPAVPPSDAIFLFDGKDLSQWQGGNEKGIEDGAINILKTGELTSKRHFGDCQVHVEWATPAVADGGAMAWGNSGVFLMGKYEVQIIESCDSHIYADGNAGAIYGQFPPLVNPTRKPGQWQTFDIIFTPPRFDGGRLVKPAYLTVFYNGVLAQYHQAVLGSTGHRLLPKYDSKETTGPIRLQQHGSAVRFRTIWVRPLKLEE